MTKKYDARTVSLDSGVLPRGMQSPEPLSAEEQREIFRELIQQTPNPIVTEILSSYQNKRVALKLLEPKAKKPFLNSDTKKVLLWLFVAAVVVLVFLVVWNLG